MFGQVHLYACQLSPDGTSCWSEEGPGISGPFFLMFSLSHISPLGKLFPIPEQSFVIVYTSLKTVLGDSCVTQTNGLEV